MSKPKACVGGYYPRVWMQTDGNKLEDMTTAISFSPPPGLVIHI